ncbi:MAG: SPFH domain-containing protein [Phycisphaerae bacterium]|nr:SPFH domain-containing protein [Phycisphaerae bacterium]
MNNENQQSDGDLQVDQMDPAQQQLAKALRSSFRLLSFLMILVLILFSVSEVTSIGPNEVGIVYRFGKIQDEVVEEGLAYAWPFMIGRVEKVDTSQREIEINDFWVYETAEDRTKPLIDRTVSSEGLRPGYDGALLTGDQSLYHVRLRCGYQIRSGDDQLTEGVHPAIQYKLNVTDAPEMIRSAICSAAIRAAAHRTVDDIYSNRGDFAIEIKNSAQKRLDTMLSGMRIVNISVTEASWPLQTLGDFAAADAARSRKKKVISDAKGLAAEILRLVAGRTYEHLVGDPIERKDQDPDDKNPYDLIGQYAKARTRGDNKESKDKLAEIDKVLSNTDGAAHDLIEKARTESKEFIENTKRRATRFTELLPKYNENPEFMLAAEWTKVLSEIFASPTVEVVVVGAGNRKINIQTKQDPATIARIVRELAKLKDPHVSGGGDE